MKFKVLGNDQTWDRLQSRWVLPAARRMYMIGAIGALAVVSLALVVALLFQVGSMFGPSSETVPDVAAASPKAIDPSALDALFAGPQDIRFTSIALELPVQSGDKLGEFSAVSPNGLRKFEMLGGQGSEFVTEDRGETRSPDSGDRMTVEGMVLRVSDDYAKQLANALSDDKQVRVLRIRVVATDLKGNLSKPQEVAFRVKLADPTATAVPATSSAADDQIEDVSAPEALEKVARGLASIAADRGTETWWDARAFALDEAERCGAEDAGGFNQAYVAAFARLEKKLTRSNLGTFYDGLCDAWAAERRSAAEESVRLNADREAIIARNIEKSIVTEVANSAARTVRNVALSVALSAIVFFMTIALFLAFLAIEGHSHAVREALQVLTRTREDA